MWQVIGASTQGTSHVRLGLPCQDAHGYSVLETYAMAAVADGLGSASKSEEGAKLAVNTVLDVLEESLTIALPTTIENWQKNFADAFAEARQSLENIAKSSSLPLRDYGTTLLVAVVTDDWLAVGHIGDGAIVALWEDDSLETVSLPQNGEYANEVTPLTAPDALKSVRFGIFPKTVKAVALFSDGLQNLSINVASGKPYAPFFAPFFDGISHAIDPEETSKQLGEFLNSERICSKTDDDKTLVVIGKIQPEIAKINSEIGV